MKRTNKSIGKIIILSFLVLFVFSIFRTVMFYDDMKELALQNAKKDASLIKDYMMSMRKVYHLQFLDSGIELSDKTIGFLPAHASSKISDEFMKVNKFNFYIKNVSDKPRNPNNLADNEELQAIEYFNKHKNQEEYLSNYIGSDGKKYFQFATPIYTKDYCLACHGKKENTMPIIQKTYDSAYNYNVGDLRGVVSIKIPEENIISDIMLQPIYSDRLPEEFGQF